MTTETADFWSFGGYYTYGNPPHTIHHLFPRHSFVSNNPRNYDISWQEMLANKFLGHREEAFVRIPVPFNLENYHYLTAEWVKNYAMTYLRGVVWAHADKFEAFHSRHDAQWSKNAVGIGRAICEVLIDRMIDDGAVVKGLVDDMVADRRPGSSGNSIVPRVIAGADWLSGETGQRIIAAAEALERENILQRLRNRIVMLDEPVAIDAALDDFPPLLGVNSVDRNRYYESRFAFEADKEPESSWYIERNVRDEHSLETFLSLDGEVSAVDARGGFWLHAGSTAKIIAVDAAGNARKATLANDDGLLADSEEAGIRADFAADLPSGE